MTADETIAAHEAMVRKVRRYVKMWLFAACLTGVVVFALGVRR